jgi:hypothetical protein
MARIRSIHPGLFSDPEFAALSDGAQIIYLGLLTEADDNGVFEWNLNKLKIRLRPLKDGSLEPFVSELTTSNKVASYEIDGRKYGAIRNFRRFQRPKSPKSWHPIPDDFRNYVCLSGEDGETPPPSTQSISEIPPQMEEGGGRREEVSKANALVGASAPKPTKRKSKLPDDWEPTDDDLAYANAQGCVDPRDTAERFKLNHLSKGTLFDDFRRGFQYWCRNEKRFGGGGRQSLENANQERIRLANEAIAK